jgi:hypothetical protein
MNLTGLLGGALMLATILGGFVLATLVSQWVRNAICNRPGRRVTVHGEPIAGPMLAWFATLFATWAVGLGIMSLIAGWLQ